MLNLTLIRLTVTDCYTSTFPEFRKRGSSPGDRNNAVVEPKIGGSGRRAGRCNQVAYEPRFLLSADKKTTKVSPARENMRSALRATLVSVKRDAFPGPIVKLLERLEPLERLELV